MAKANPPTVHMDMPLEEALDLVRAVRALKDRLHNQPAPLQGAQVIAKHLQTVCDFSDAISNATHKAI